MAAYLTDGVLRNLLTAVWPMALILLKAYVRLLLDGFFEHKPQVAASGRRRPPFPAPRQTVCERLNPTQTGHPNFPEAAAEARWLSVSFAATKLPFVTSRLRPSPVARPVGRVAARTAAPLGLQPFGQSPVRFVQSTARRAG